MNNSDLELYTKNVCDELVRYRGVFSENLLCAIEKIADVNNGLHTARDLRLIRRQAEEAVSFLRNAIEEEARIRHRKLPGRLERA